MAGTWQVLLLQQCETMNLELIKYMTWRKFPSNLTYKMGTMMLSLLDCCVHAK